MQIIMQSNAETDRKIKTPNENLPIQYKRVDREVS